MSWGIEWFIFTAVPVKWLCIGNCLSFESKAICYGEKKYECTFISIAKDRIISYSCLKIGYISTLTIFYHIFVSFVKDEIKPQILKVFS